MISLNNNYYNNYFQADLNVLKSQIKQQNFSAEIEQEKENIEPSISNIIGACRRGSFFPVHQTLPGISVIPTTWGIKLPVKGQDRAFKATSQGNYIFIGILDGVSGKPETSKSELVAQYFAEGICSAIAHSKNSNLKDIIYKGYRIACITASKDRDLFPESSENNVISKGASSTLSIIRMSPTKMESGDHQGKYQAQIFVLGDSGVAVFLRRGDLTGFICGSNEFKKPGQVHLRYAKFDSNESSFHSFSQECAEKYPSDRIRAVRKISEVYLERGDFIIAASDGLWDNLKPEDVHEIIIALQSSFPIEDENNTLPYAYIIAEIANFISKQPSINMNFGGKSDDISIVVSRAGIKEEIKVNEEIMEKFSYFISEQCGIFFNQYRKKNSNKRSFTMSIENSFSPQFKPPACPLASKKRIDENNMKSVELLLKAAAYLRDYH